MSTNISSTDCSLYRSSAKASIDVSEDSKLIFRAQLGQGVHDFVVLNKRVTLNQALTAFKNALPKLPLWERFKALFGLSDTANNRRIFSNLYTMGIFYEVCRNVSLPDDSYRQLLSEFRYELQKAGIASRHDKLTPATMTADIAAYLLKERPVLYGNVILLNQPRLVMDEGNNGGIKLQGYLSITGIDNALCLLPFETQEENTELLYDFITRNPTVRSQLLNEFFSTLPFTQTLSLITPATPKRISSWEDLAKEYQARREADGPKDVAIQMPEMMFTHGESPVAAESRMTFDIHRANLQKADVTVNGRMLSRETVEHMHRVAWETAQNEGISSEECGNVVSQAWTRLLEDETGDIREASLLAAAIMYSCYQGGAGTGIVKMLANMGPKYPEILGKHTINVDIGSDYTQVRQTLSNSLCADADHPQPSEFRFGGVDYTLPHPPALDVSSPLQIAAGYLSKEVKVAGIGFTSQQEKLLTNLF